MGQISKETIQFYQMSHMPYTSTMIPVLISNTGLIKPQRLVAADVVYYQVNLREFWIKRGGVTVLPLRVIE